MRPFEGRLQYFDDLAGEGLADAIRANIKILKLKESPEATLQFGPRTLLLKTYIRSLEELLAQFDNASKSILQKGGVSSFESWKEFLENNFEPYEIYGQKKWGDVFMTSYYVPIIEGSLRKTQRFTQPLYGVPSDMVKVEIGEFARVNKALESLNGEVLEQKSPSPILRGRLIKSSSMSAPYRVVPYFDRKEIDQDNNLQGRKLELVWVDPIEAFFLQIQGSGIVELPGKKQISIGYASQNGHPYVPIGKFLLDRIPKDQMSLQSIERELRKMNPEEMQSLLNQNPSYVFFRKLKSEAIAYLGTEVVDGRTIATDTKYFPKGALAYLEFEKPQFSNSEDTVPDSWQNSSRFVLDQDTGGAIRGPGRLDLFWGKGKEARQVAGVMKNWGRLYY
ncbi:MAG: MltA domain-containing protein, partial [Bdellovibrionales bacterium]|nr:MltA domain-containing protein [Bdellovibrionales bacterium]